MINNENQSLISILLYLSYNYSPEITHLLPNSDKLTTDNSALNTESDNEINEKNT